MDFDAIAWVGVPIAAVVFFLLGGVWYGPLFGSPWMRLSNLTEEQARQSNLPLIFVGTLVLEVLAAVGLAAIIGETDEAATGMWVGLAIAGLVVIPVLAVQAVYDRKPIQLFALNAGYNLVGLTAMGIILGSFQ